MSDDFRPGKVWSLPAWKKPRVPIEPVEPTEDTPEEKRAKAKRGGMANAKQLKRARRLKSEFNPAIFKEETKDDDAG